MASKRLFIWKEYMVKHFPTTSNSELAERIGVSEATVSRWSEILGLEKHRPRYQKRKTYERFLDPRYQEWRLGVLGKTNFKCQRCGKPSKDTKRGSGLDCHHIMSWAKHPRLRYDVKNGVALCRKCHSYVHKTEGWN